jgi:hypothetical protein
LLPGAVNAHISSWGIRMSGVYLATMITFATAAFGLVAALAWNAFITELVASVLGAQGGLMGLLIYAVVVTILAVVVITWLGRMAERTGTKPTI